MTHIIPSASSKRQDSKLFRSPGMQSPLTFQCHPTANVRPDDPTVTEAIHLIVANRHARAAAASVPQCYGEDTAPSDHWPVQATYELVLIRPRRTSNTWLSAARGRRSRAPLPTDVSPEVQLISPSA